MSDSYGCRTIAELVSRHARERPDAVAMIHGERVTTYGELDARANQVAHALVAMGLRPQDRIAYLGKNSDLFFELLFGAPKANVIVVPINWRLAPAEMNGVLANADPTVPVRRPRLR